MKDGEGWGLGVCVWKRWVREGLTLQHFGSHYVRNPLNASLDKSRVSGVCRTGRVKGWFESGVWNMDAGCGRLGFQLAAINPVIKNQT